MIERWLEWVWVGEDSLQALLQMCEFAIIYCKE